MARRINDLFIGTEYLSLEGRTIKHPSLINEYGTININKVSTEPLKFTGLDIETNHLTGEMKLMGFYLYGQYRKYTERFLERLFNILKWAERKDMNLAYWNKLDPFQIFRLFLLEVDEYEQRNALKRYGKVGGVWDRETNDWDEDNPPVISVKIGNYEFGIQIVIRSAIKFFIKSERAKSPRYIWAYDIATLYQYGIEREALGLFDKETQSYPNARLPYYSKVDESAHLVDWERYEVDSEYMKMVDHSNYLDARAAHDLADHFQRDFYKAFNYYPRTLISAGSIARASVVAVILNKYKAKIPSKKLGIPRTTEYAKAFADIESISLITHYDEWMKKYDPDVIKNILSITTESYKGGQIDALEFGFVKEAWYSDLSGAYPGFIQQLYDLRGATITSGTGEPPTIDHSYCFIRGIVNIPEHVNIHPLTIKHPIALDTNIRAVGSYRASYLKEERDYLIELGATFTEEEWYNVETTGKLSPIAEVSKQLSDLRTHFLSLNDTAEYIAKASNNSLYGVQFEATNTHYQVPLIYKPTDVKIVLKSALDYNSSYKFDLNMTGTELNELVDTTIDMLVDKVPIEKVSDIITEDIMDNAYAINDSDDTEVYNIIKGFLKKINLEPILPDLKHHFGDEYRLHYNRFNSTTGLYYDEVINELSIFGLHFDKDKSSVDNIIELMLMFEKYRVDIFKTKKIDLNEVLSIHEFDQLENTIKDFIETELMRISNISIFDNGYRAGEFFNPLYSAWITSQTRIILSKAANSVVNNGGKVLSLLTDSVFWEGSPDMLDKSLWTEIKTTGYFEPPAMVTDFLSLGAGRYEYTENGRYINKKRGLNTTDWHSSDGLDRTEMFSWHAALSNPKYQTSEGKIKVNVRTLVSVGMIANSRKRIEDGEIRGYDIYDLGKIINQEREVDALIGLTKRFIVGKVGLESLLTKTITTTPITINPFIFGKTEVIDQTLPKLRKMMMEITPETSNDRRRRVSAKSSRTYYNKHKERILDDYKVKYNALRVKGYTRTQARSYAVYSFERLKTELNIDIER